MSTNRELAESVKTLQRRVAEQERMIGHLCVAISGCGHDEPYESYVDSQRMVRLRGKQVLAGNKKAPIGGADAKLLVASQCLARIMNGTLNEKDAKQEAGEALRKIDRITLEASA